MQEQEHGGGLLKRPDRRFRECEVIEHLKAGVPQQEISRRFGISRRTVSNIKKRNGVVCNLRYKCSKSEKRIALKLKRMGLSDVYIANLLGVRASCLFKY